MFFAACIDCFSLLTYIPAPIHAVPTTAKYIRFSLPPPPPVGPVDMWTAGSHVGILAWFNPKGRNIIIWHGYEIMHMLVFLMLYYLPPFKHSIKFGLLQLCRLQFTYWHLTEQSHLPWSYWMLSLEEIIHNKTININSMCKVLPSIIKILCNLVYSEQQKQRIHFQSFS